MIYTVVPIKNEEDKILATLQMLLKTQTDKVLMILNGCEDASLEKSLEIKDSRLDCIYFNKPLGVDVPRAIGASIALRQGAEGIVFVDGDMNGNIESEIDKLIISLKEDHIDMALTNCYPENHFKSNMARLLLSFRKQLNTELNVFQQIGYAIPSHGPHGISRRLLENVPIKEIAIPPVSLALAVKKRLKISVAASIPDVLLQSTLRDEYHANQMVKTIIGDCIEALHAYHDSERNRGYDGITFTGYHKNRRFDLLESFLESES